jgi:hypothetical protein
MTRFWRTLKDWGRVVSSIEYSARQQTLDSRETDLIWLLRSENPRFRSTALKALQHLRYRSDRLLAELVRIMEDETAYSDTRIAAADGFAHVVSREQWPDGSGRRLNRTHVERLRALLDRPNPTELGRAVRHALAVVEQGLAGDLARNRGY